MSKTVKIKTNRASRFGQTIGIPNEGNVEVPNNGVIEVTEETAKLLVEKGRAWEYTDEKVGKVEKKEEVKEEATEEVKEEATEEVKEPAVETNNANGGDSAEIEEVATEEATEEVVEDSEATEGIDISEMNMKELKAVATEAELPKEEWSGIKSKADFRTYLTEKLS